MSTALSPAARPPVKVRIFLPFLYFCALGFVVGAAREFDSDVNIILLAIAGGLVGLAGLGVGLTWRKTGFRWRPCLRLTYFSILWVLWIVAFHFLPITVYVDNSSAQDVVLEVDGQEWLRPSRKSKTIDGLPRGEHTIVVRSRPSGEVLDRLTVKVDTGGPYVLNVLRAQKYYKGTATYSTVAFPFGGQGRQTIDAPWFRAKVDYLFENPPESIYINSRDGVNTATKTYLVRVEPEGREEK